MSWGEIKKVNSDMGKPLDVLIEEKTGAVNATGGTATAGGIFAKLNKLLTDWTTARAGKVDNIDTTVSSRASQASITTLQNTANAINTATTELINGRVVKSVQRGVITGTTASSRAVPISAVNVNKSLVLVDGDVSSSDPVPGAIILGFTSTSITIASSKSAGEVSVSSTTRQSWQVIEFY